MNLDFWDGVIISSVFWFIASSMCLICGLLAGIHFFSDNWSEGFDDGWKAAEEYHETEIIEREEGLNV